MICECFNKTKESWALLNNLKNTKLVLANVVLDIELLEPNVRKLENVIIWTSTKNT